jgi:hypothetical protein
VHCECGKFADAKCWLCNASLVPDKDGDIFYDARNEINVLWPYLELPDAYCKLCHANMDGYTCLTFHGEAFVLTDDALEMKKMLLE